MEKKKNAKVAAPKPNGKKTVGKKVAGPRGKTSGLPRTSWFMNFIREHKNKMPTDEKILAMAIAEFGKEYVGPGTVFVPRQMRSWWNCFCKRGSRGLSKKDMIVETAEVTT